MIPLMTPVQIAPAPFAFTPQTKVTSLGSCFAQHIASRLEQALPPNQVCANPFGVIYDVQSLAQALQWLLTTAPLPSDCFFQDREGLWKSWLHAGEFAAESVELCVQKTQQSLHKARLHLQQSHVLLITFSTACYHALHPDSPYATTAFRSVSNCHKMPTENFIATPMSFTTMCSLWEELLQGVSQSLPKLKILFTLSPYRYAKYGLQQSAVDKAKLRLLIDELCTRFDCCAYFPSYEILLDELRDYRFYDRDLLHPSTVAIDYIWERFAQSFFSETLQCYSKERLQLLRQKAHRPLHPESPAHQQFLKKLEAAIAVFEKKWGTSL